MNVRLNIDLGELDGESEELYAYAHLANVACGGHAGDGPSIDEAIERCIERGTDCGAHPSYPDRANFGRAALQIAANALRSHVATQCELLLERTERAGVCVTHVKPHGALYHDAHRDPGIAAACVAGAVEALGYDIAVIGPAGGALHVAATEAGLAYWREGFADRGMRRDGSLVPRGQPGDVVSDPRAAAARARALVDSGDVETICVHGDSPGAESLARAVREVLDVANRTDTGGAIAKRFGDSAIRIALPATVAARATMAAWRALPDVRDVVWAGTSAGVLFKRAVRDSDIAACARAVVRGAEPLPAQTHTLRVRYDGEDLREIAAYTSRTIDEVVALHAGTTYTVRMLGFLPGFAYLGDVDERIAIPRRAHPRTRVPANAVAIAGRYTGVYPFASAGGWNLVGTAIDGTMFDPAAGPRFGVGDRVTFVRA